MLKNGQYFVQKNKERIKITYFMAVATHSMAFIHTLALKYSSERQIEATTLNAKLKEI